MLYYLLLLVYKLELQVAPALAQGMNFTFHAGGGSKWAKALRK